MSTAITDFTFGSDLKAAPDAIFSAQALPDSTTLLSSAFKFGQTLGANEIKVVVNTAGTLTAALNIEVQSSATETGSYATVAGGTFTTALGAIAVGDELVKYIAPREDENIFYKLLITTTEDESAMKVDGYIVYVS